MIERLQLRNFQAHSDLKIKLDPEVTTIVGPSDVGKSSIIRALRWLFFNRPSGESFIRDGEEKTRVSLWFDGNKRLMREKGKATNRMVLEDKEYKAFGTNLPEEVVESLNVTDVNFQQQHDTPFWFCDTPGAVSQKLNAIVNLDVIDKSMSIVASLLRKCRSEVEVCVVRLDEAKEKQKELEFVPDFLESWEHVRGLGNTRDECSNVAGSATLLTDEAITYRMKHLQACKARLQAEKVIDRGNEVEKLSQRLEDLGDLVDDARHWKDKASVSIPEDSEVDEIGEQLQSNMDRKSRLLLLDRNVKQALQQKENCLEEDLGFGEVVASAMGCRKARSKLGGVLVVLGDVSLLERKATKTKKDCEEAKERLYEDTEGICPLCEGVLK